MDPYGDTSATFVHYGDQTVGGVAEDSGSNIFESPNWQLSDWAKGALQSVKDVFNGGAGELSPGAASAAGGATTAAGTAVAGGGIGGPNFLESSVPVVGSTWESIHDFSNGHWIMGTAFAAMAVLDLTGVGEVGDLALKGVLRVAQEISAKEGIYEFTAASGKTYVGQSRNIAARIQQHINSGKLLTKDIGSIRTTEVLGGKTAREIAEQRRINELGGISKLENQRNPIGPARQHLLQ